MRTAGRIAAALLAAALVAACSSGGDDDDAQPAPRSTSNLRLDEIQVLGSHNSYHVEPAPALMGPLKQFSRGLAESIEYTHVVLRRQLDSFGIRQMEIDVWADPEGGHYLHRSVPAYLKIRGATGPPDLAEPGYKVFHIQDLDFRSRCVTFLACLADINEWSDGNPDHLPVLILVEVKQDPIVNPEAEALGIHFTVPKQIDAADADALDAEIHKVIADDTLLTPDEVRGSSPSLRDAVVERGWPKVDDLRGKLLFFLIDGGPVRDVYVKGHRSLEGRAMFTNSPDDSPEASIFNIDDPIGDGPRIGRLVKQGFLVRTRTDADTREARTGDTKRREAAFASGAQFGSTDYYRPDPRLDAGYRVELPGGDIARCNPVTAPPDCDPADLKE